MKRIIIRLICLLLIGMAIYILSNKPVSQLNEPHEQMFDIKDVSQISPVPSFEFPIKI